MIAYLYRYPHPDNPNKFLYVGQETVLGRRHSDHLRGLRGFGLRFKKQFPTQTLPEPIREQVEVENARELNELETIWMFQYHTWRGYGGMNLQIPGGEDYKVAGKLGALSQVASGMMSRKGKLQGTKNNKNGHMYRMREKNKNAGRNLVIWNKLNNFNSLPQVKAARSRNAKKMGQEAVRSGRLLKFCSLGGKIGGKKNVLSGHLERIRTPQSSSKGGLYGTHQRWHVLRGVINKSCSLCESL